MEELTEDEINEIIDVLKQHLIRLSARIADSHNVELKTVIRLAKTIDKLENVLISETNQEQKIHSE